MITGQLVSPWAETPPPMAGRHPKIADDYTLESCRTAEARAPAGTFAAPGKAATQVPVQIASPWKDGKPLTGMVDVPAQPAPVSVVQSPPGPCVPVIVRCTHEVWEAIIHDSEYGPVHWYQEDGKEKRILS